VNFDAVYDSVSWSGNLYRYPASYTDGTSNTILFGEQYSRWDWTWQGQTYAEYNYWWGGNWFYAYNPVWNPDNTWTKTPFNPPFQVKPTYSQVNINQAQAFSFSGLNVSLLDGSVRSINPAISPATFAAVCSPSSGDLPGSDW
jgi:hypothetical protein